MSKGQRRDRKLVDGLEVEVSPLFREKELDWSLDSASWSTDFAWNLMYLRETKWPLRKHEVEDWENLEVESGSEVVGIGNLLVFVEMKKPPVTVEG